MHKERILKPHLADDFDKMCKHIYGIVYNCLTPKTYGRSGQAQHGVDILVQKNNVENIENRIGIQCKHVSKLTFDKKSGDSICKEVEKADEGIQTGLLNISHLIIATSLPSDVQLIQQVNKYSDQRKEKGLFTVSIESWDEIAEHIHNNKNLGERYINPDRFYEKLLKEMQKNFNNNSFSAVLDNSHIVNDSFSSDEKMKILQILALSHAYSNNIIEAKKNIELAIQIAPNDKSIMLSKLYILSLDSNSEEFDSYIEHINFEDSEEDFIIEVELTTSMYNKVELPVFEKLPTILADRYDIKLRYLLEANGYNYHLQFQKIYDLLSEDEKDKPEIILLKIQDALQQQNIQLATRLAKQYFFPRYKKVWNIEHIVIRDNIILTLLRIHALNNEYSKMLELLDEVVVEKNSIGNDIVAGYLEVAVSTNNSDIFKKIKEEYLKNLTSFSFIDILNFTRISVKFGDNGFAEFLHEYVTENFSQEEIDRHSLIIWLAEYINDHDILVDKIYNSSIFSSPYFHSLYELIIIVKPLKEDNIKLTSLYEYAVEIANKSLEFLENNLFYLPKVLHYFELTQQPNEAYKLLKSLPSNNYIERKLLSICLEINKNREAEKYLNAIEFSTLIHDDYLVHNAIVLAHNTLDWDLFNKIVIYKEKINELNAYLWLIKIEFLRKYQPLTVIQTIRNLPENISGDNNHLFSISFIEIKYGFKEKGLERIYPIIRNNLYNAEILTNFFQIIIELPSDDPLSKVTFGSTVTYIDNYGKSRSIAIDFDGNYIHDDEFISKDSEFAKILLGKSVGDIFSIEKMGLTDVYTIINIQSVYHTIYKIMHKNINAPNFSGSLKSMHADLNDIESTVIHPILKMGEQRKQYIQSMFLLYKTIPATLHFLSKRIGIEAEAFNLVYEWPINPDIPMYTDSYGENSFINNEFMNIFIDSINQFPIKLNKEIIFVIDALTLLELEYHAGLETLLLLKDQLIVSNHTLDTLMNWKESLKYNKSNFSIMTTDDNRLLRLENDHTISLERIEKVIQFVQTYCNVYSAYGCDDESVSNHYQIFTQLSSEQQSIILLCQEKEAVLLNLDGRLRLWSDTVFQINTADIGNVLAYLNTEKLLSDISVIKIIMSQINNNRRSAFWLFIPIYVDFMSLNEANFKTTLLKLVDDLKANILSESAIKNIIKDLQREITDKFIVDHEDYQLLEYWFIHGLLDNGKYEFLQLIHKIMSKKINYFKSKQIVEIDKFEVSISNSNKPVLKYLYD